MELLKNDKIAWSMQVIKQGLSYNLLDMGEARKNLKALSLKKLAELIEAEPDDDIKITLLGLYIEKGQKKAVPFALDHALNLNETELLRTSILKQISILDSAQCNQKSVRRLIEALTIVASKCGEQELSFIREIYNLIEQNKNLAERLEALKALENIVAINRAPIRSRAIALLGFFGEIDLIERLCMLPVEDERDRRALDFAIQGILSRPLNIVLLNPKNFEHLMGTLFQKMGYENVKVSRYTKDNGIDIEALSPREEKCVFIQCKRNQPSKVMRAKELRDFDKNTAEKFFNNNNMEAIFVSTLWGLSDDAKKYMETRKYSWPLRVISGGELLRLLDEHLQSDKYQIETPLSERNLSINLNLFD